MPIDAGDHSLIPVPVPQCLKPGSWPLLASGDGHATFHRLGRPTRYCLPPVRSTRGPSRYVLIEVAFDVEGPDAALTPLNAQQRLALMVQYESLRLPGLNGDQVQPLLDWLTDLPAWGLHYRDTVGAVRLLGNLADRIDTRSTGDEGVSMTRSNARQRAGIRHLYTEGKL